MVGREFDPRRLDVAVFAKHGGALHGAWPLATLRRVAESVAADSPVGERDGVSWTARGESRPERGGASQVWLHVHADACVSLQCQRCLKAVAVPLQVDRRFRFVHGEDAAAQLDADSEDDVLALTHALDLRELIEDELLLAMPIVPRHDVCPEPLPAPADDLPADDEAAPHPFAALAALKRTPLN